MPLLFRSLALSRRVIHCFPLLALLFVPSMLQAVELPYQVEWTRQFGTTSSDTSNSVAVDRLGNIYISGKTYGDLEGAGNRGIVDAFLAKYDAEGNFAWTKQLGSNFADSSKSVAIDALGNIYISGNTNGDLDGSGNQDDNDAFLAKYDAEGNFVWAKHLASNSDDLSNCVAIDGTGNSFICGNTNGELGQFGNRGGADAFLAKFDSEGNIAWAKQIGSSENDHGTGVAVDGEENIFICGNTSGSLEGNQNQGEVDTFLAKYDTHGKRLWMTQLGSNTYDQCTSIAVDALGNAFVSGYTAGDLNMVGSLGGADVFLAKFDTEGGLEWIMQWGTSGNDFSTSVAVDAEGNSFISGSTDGDLEGNGNQGGADAFLAKFDPEGNCMWAKQIGSSGNDQSHGVAADSMGNLFISGNTSGDLEGNEYQGDSNAFLIKLSTDP